MTAPVTVPSDVTLLLRAVGLLDADGHVDDTWFQDPVGSIRRILAEPSQRAALLELLDSLLEPVTDSPPGSSWHPLLDPGGLGNAYITITGDVVGVAAALSTPDDVDPAARIRFELPLIDTAGGQIRAIAATREGPLQLGVDLDLPADAPISALRVEATVDVDGDAELRLVIDGVAVGSATRTLEISTKSTGTDLAVALEALARAVLLNLTGSDTAGQLIASLLGVLGLDPSRPVLPIAELLSDPAAIRTWLAALADPAHPEYLRGWFTDLTQLLGGQPPGSSLPLQAPLVELAPDTWLKLSLADIDDELHLGLALEIGDSGRSFEADVTLIAIPLVAGPAVRPVPDAAVRVRVTGAGGALVEPDPLGASFSIGEIFGGIRFDGASIRPELVATAVQLPGQPPRSIDLTDVNAVTGLATGAIGAAIEAALGTDGPAPALLALLGLVPPRPPAGAPAGWPLLNLSALAGGPTAAIAAFHRTLLADPNPEHSWSLLLGELARLLALPDTVGGAGVETDPWTIELGREGIVEVDLAAWDARLPTDAAGDHRLRLGVLVRATSPPWTTRLLGAILSFDLPATGAGPVHLVGRHELQLTLDALPAVSLADGIELTFGHVAATAAWTPGLPLAADVAVVDLRITADGTAVGPVTLRFDPTGATTGPDLGLGADVAELWSILRLLAHHALRIWAGDGAAAIGSVLGLDDALAPLELPDEADLRSLFANPGSVLRARLHDLLTAVDPATGQAVPERLLSAVGTLLRDEVAQGRGAVGDALPVTGIGSYDDPWAVPLTADDHGALQVLAWLEPDGPPRQWASMLATEALAATDAAALLSLLRPSRAFLPSLPAWADSAGGADVAGYVTSLARWLALGDGVVPLASQLPGLAGWTEQELAACPHDALPANPEAIEAIRTQLAAWSAADGAATPVLLLGPSWATHDVWSTLLDTLQPSVTDAASVRFDLRGGAPTSAVTAAAAFYTADLDDDPAANLSTLADQAGQAADRIVELTMQARVIVVAHSTAGLVARALGELRPDLVRSLITLGTPHDGAPPAPLFDHGLADAVRLVHDLGADQLESTTRAAITRLDHALDGGAGSIRASDFVPAPASATTGLALGSALGGDLIDATAHALAARLQALAAAPAVGSATRSAPTHLGLGLRVRLPIDITDAGDVTVDARARLDAARIRFASAPPEPARPASALDVQVDLVRPGGWLAGGAATSGARLRSATVGATLFATPGGGVQVEPRLVLRDASLPAFPGAAQRHDIGLGDGDLAVALEAVAEGVGIPGAHTRLAELEQLATAPAAFLLARRDALLEAVGGPLVVKVGAVGVELSVDPATWTLHVRTLAALPLGDGAALEIDGRVGLIGFTPQLDATLRVGAVRLAATSADGRVTLAAPPWLDPLVLVPLPYPAAVADALIPLVPRLALSAGLSAALGALAQTANVIGPLDRILANPGAALSALTGADIQTLLRGIAKALGLDDALGLPLPGGLLLSASGADAIHVALDATVELDQPSDTLTIELTLDISPARTVSVGGAITVDVGLPGTGDWNRVAVAFGAGPLGATLVVTPDGAPAITLLPHFSGFGDLVTAGAGSLLPEVLQALRDEFPTPGAFGEAVLSVAASLGIYATATSSFTGATEVQKLRAMLLPQWWADEIDDPAALAGLVGALFGDDKLPLPAGHSVTATGGLLRYAVDLAVATANVVDSGTVAVEVRLGEPVLVRLGVTGLDLGPLVVEEVRAGFEGDLDFAIAVRLDLGGDLGFLRPRVELSFDDAHLAAAILPLGEAERAQLALQLAPTPELVADEAGLLALLTGWGLPLAMLLGLQAVGDALLDESLWTGGPTPRSVLEGALVLQAAAPGAPPELALPFAPLEQIALGALFAMADGLNLEIDDLTLSIQSGDGGRKGLRLKGKIDLGDDPVVSLRFGDAWWLEDLDDSAGVTLWAFKPAAGMPPIALDPGLDVIGLGAVIGNEAPDPDATPEDDGPRPLIEGAFTAWQVGGLLFFKLDFLDEAGRPTVAATEIGAALEIDGAQITVSADDGDSFIKKLLPAELQAPFDLAVSGRSGRGVEVFGGIGDTEGAIELTFRLDLDLGGIIFLRELFLSARRDGSAAAILAAISGNASLGPVAVNVDRVGLRVRIGSGGAKLEFKPPDGFGVSMDTSVIRLGGYLLVDEEHGRYVGAVEIAIVQKFSLVAVAIVTTKRPDGSEGFSLLILLAITFPVPIPLGFGFFLGGAGGLLGLNRGIDLDRLRLGLRSGTADSILFPTDVIRRIDTIVRDLEEVFPIAEGHFLIAPMVLITWSTPPLVTAKIGVIVEIGSPLRLAILGVLQLALPDPKTPVVNLKVAFLGAIDIPGSMLSFDASIYDSSIGYGDFCLSLEGDMALRVCWGPTPDFVVTIGGFHPSFTPAANLRLPPLRRLSVSLMKDNPRITLSTYFAVTSNSVQLGARLELLLDIAGFSIHGDAGFDVLIQIVPLHLEAHLWVSLAVRMRDTDILSINLDLTVEGPSPWIARGKAHFSILCVSVDVAVEATMGERVPTELPKVAVLTDLVKALNADGAWSAQLGGGSPLITLRPPKKGDLVLDAAGQLTVQQRLMPLGRDISLFGTATPIDVSRVTISSFKIGSRTATRQAGTLRDVTDAFAPAAYQRLSDQDKLAAPSFEQMPAGVQSATGDGLTTDGVVPHRVHYETLVYDSVPDGAGVPHSVSVDATGLRVPDQARFQQLALGGAIGTSAGSVAQTRRGERGAAYDIAPLQERYGVVIAGDTIVRNAAGGVTFATGEPRFLPRSAAELRRDALNHTSGATTYDILPEAQLVFA